jgi:hypothetical protein
MTEQQQPTASVPSFIVTDGGKNEESRAFINGAQPRQDTVSYSPNLRRTSSGNLSSVSGYSQSPTQGAMPGLQRRRTRQVCNTVATLSGTLFLFGACNGDYQVMNVSNLI